MAKGIRSKIKKKNRSYMRATIGEKVRTSQIEAASARLKAKRDGRAVTRTLLATKGALSGVDLGKAYYEAIVRPSRKAVEEVVVEPEAMDEDENDEEDTKKLEIEDEIISRLTAVVPKNGKIRTKLAGTGIFSKRPRRAPKDPNRPPKVLAKFE
mmetsp:Transcript_1433/g.1881  ORF Transcript_1433/g.1881 Transcript_1433/m.1881 type:complete len:154 (-) Transcript_1433:99-560(-)